VADCRLRSIGRACWYRGREQTILQDSGCRNQGHCGEEESVPSQRLCGGHGWGYGSITAGFASVAVSSSAKGTNESSISSDNSIVILSGGYRQLRFFCVQRRQASTCLEHRLFALAHGIHAACRSGLGTALPDMVHQVTLISSLVPFLRGAIENDERIELSGGDLGAWRCVSAHGIFPVVVCGGEASATWVSQAVDRGQYQ
jgi:hypothetical protein